MPRCASLSVHENRRRRWSHVSAVALCAVIAAGIIYLRRNARIIHDIRHDGRCNGDPYQEAMVRAVLRED